MPARRNRLQATADVPARLAPAQAVQRLRAQIGRLEEIRKLAYDHPRYEAWVHQTRDVLNDALGKPGGDLHESTHDFTYGPARVTCAGMSPAEHQTMHEERIEYQVARLNAIIESLEAQTPNPTPAPATQVTEASASGHERWGRIRELGSGGQGMVYLVTDRRGIEVSNAEIQNAIALATRVLPPDEQDRVIEKVRKWVEKVVLSVDPAMCGALKVLHEPKDARNPETAGERLRREIEAMSEIKHPNLLRIIHSDPDHRWYVSEYHELGPLSRNARAFVGDVRGALRAVRPLIEGVASLHSKGFVHRDVKPDNIFVARDGRLVLGDFGLVFFADAEHTRVSETLENVGSVDWMPPWAQRMRVEDVRPNFDVFCLAKTLWWMVSGEDRMRHHYYDDPEFDLERKFPENVDVPRLNGLFKKCIVERPASCLADGQEMLNEIDNTLVAIDLGTGPDGLRTRCLMCGRGEYRLIAGRDHASITNFGLEPRGVGEFRVYACQNCGHVQLHHRSGNFKPDSWPGLDA